jgi:2-keto-3-deoxy-L-rhamnonate aldolase RhmA
VLLAAIDDVLALAREAGMPAGIWAPAAEPARPWIDRGVAIVIVGSDLGFMAEGVERAFAALREKA